MSPEALIAAAGLWMEMHHPGWNTEGDHIERCRVMDAYLKRVFNNVGLGDKLHLYWDDAYHAVTNQPGCAHI